MTRGSRKVDAETPRRTGDGDEFAAAMQGVRKLGGAARLSPLDVPPPTVRPAGRGGRKAVQHHQAHPAPPTLAVEDSGLLWIARADGVDRRIVRKLRSGEIPVEGRVDLHGLTRVPALHALQQLVERARASALRHLLIVHGRGLRSGAEGPTLPALVRVELTTGPTAAHVLACGTAAAALGGVGATFVFLRR